MPYWFYRRGTLFFQKCGILYSMAPFLTLQFIAPLLVGIFSLGMGWFVLRAERKNITYHYFFGIMAAIAVWSFLIALFHVPQVVHGTWTSLHWIAGIFISPVY
mgnify:CR=1 FL=1